MGSPDEIPKMREMEGDFQSKVNQIPEREIQDLLRTIKFIEDISP